MFHIVWVPRFKKVAMFDIISDGLLKSTWISLKHDLCTRTASFLCIKQLPFCGLKQRSVKQTSDG